MRQIIPTARVYYLALSIAFLWCLTIVGYPWIIRWQMCGPAVFISWFFSHLCHQIPERSLHLAGSILPVCARCSAIYFGLLAAILSSPVLVRNVGLPLWVRGLLISSILLLALDAVTDITSLRDSSLLSRVVTGSLFGGAVGLSTFSFIRRGRDST